MFCADPCRCQTEPLSLQELKMEDTKGICECTVPDISAFVCHCLESKDHFSIWYKILCPLVLINYSIPKTLCSLTVDVIVKYMVFETKTKAIFF